MIDNGWTVEHILGVNNTSFDVHYNCLIGQSSASLAVAYSILFKQYISPYTTDMDCDCIIVLMYECNRTYAYNFNFSNIQDML